MKKTPNHWWMSLIIGIQTQTEKFFNLLETL